MRTRWTRLRLRWVRFPPRRRSGRPTGQATLVAVLASIAGLIALVLVVLTGHLGAQAVWNPAG